MVVDVAVVADYANLAEGGKLNVMGMFDQIWAKEFPAAHAYMVLAYRLRVGYEDGGKQYRIEIKLVDEDGRQWGGTSGIISVSEIAAGERQVLSQILSFPGLLFPRAGEYAFVLSIDGDELHRVPFTLRLLQSPSSGR
jgi:hypothetical protein